MADRWPALLTANEACEYLSISLTKFKELRTKGYVKAVRVDSDRVIRFRLRDLDRWVEGLPECDGGKPISARMARMMG